MNVKCIVRIYNLQIQTLVWTYTIRCSLQLCELQYRLFNVDGVSMCSLVLTLTDAGASQRPEQCLIIKILTLVSFHIICNLQRSRKGFDDCSFFFVLTRFPGQLTRTSINPGED